MPALPPYRLQTLLEVRERKKEAAERHLGETMAALRREEKRLEEMEEELRQMIARREAKRREFMEKAMQGEISARAAIASNKYIDRLKELEAVQLDAIAGQKALVKERQEDVEKAREQLIAANQELKALEKHREKWLEEVKKDRQAREEMVMDEQAQNVFLRREVDAPTRRQPSRGAGENDDG